MVIIAGLTFVFIGYFFIYHLRLILYDRTYIETKYRISVNKKEQEEIAKLKLKEKMKFLYKNLIYILKGESLFDLFWPD